MRQFTGTVHAVSTLYRYIHCQQVNKTHCLQAGGMYVLVATEIQVSLHALFIHGCVEISRNRTTLARHFALP